MMTIRNNSRKEVGCSMDVQLRTGFKEGTRGWSRGQLRKSWIKRKGAYKEVNLDDYCSKGTLRRKLEITKAVIHLTAFFLCLIINLLQRDRQAGQPV